jgi:hypothetical protein
VLDCGTNSEVVFVIKKVMTISNMGEENIHPPEPFEIYHIKTTFWEYLIIFSDKFIITMTILGF